MMLEKKQRKRDSSTAFWDTSAIIPLCCFHTTSNKARQLTRMYGRQIVWWATSVEGASALQRLIREGETAKEEITQFNSRLKYLRERWTEIQPSEQVRSRAEQLLRMHILHAADALQLAAALVWCNGYTQERCFVAADNNLAYAAEIEGFEVIKL
jgi:predicted nucleic acid-binding protein